MALVPNYFTDALLEADPETDDWTETMASISIESGYYRPGVGGGGETSRSGDKESVLLEQTKTILNQAGSIIRRDSEEWSYDVYKGPPTEYKRQTESTVRLPKIGPGLKTVEEEEIVYWTFTPLGSGENLGRTRFVSAYVVYDLPVEPEKPTSGEAAEKAEEEGIKPGPTQDRIVDSGRLWSEINHDSGVARSENTNQVAKWVKNVIVEHDHVEEEVDKWTIWTIRKNALKPGDVEILGPTHVKKTGFVYQFPVALEAPKLIEAQSRSKGVFLEAKGGGATYKNRYFRQSIVIVPDKYNFYRATISEPDREASSDRPGWWDPDPAPKEKPKIIGTSDVTDQDGVPADPKPPSAGHSEPGDVDPPEPPPEVTFEMIGTVENDNARRYRDEGHATFLDLDVETGGEYEYYVEAVYNEQVSPESNHLTVTYIGQRSRSQRIGVRTNDDGSVEIDADAPDDPGVPPDDYGEVEDFDVPADVPEDEYEDFVDPIADRQFEANEPDFNIDIDVLIPMLGLEYGQGVQLPSIIWKTYGKQLIMTQGTLPERWMLNGFRMSFERNNDGGWSSQRTTLSLRQRGGR